jgi:ribosomal protein S20
MVHLKSSAKRLRQSQKKAADNKKIKDSIKSLLKETTSKKDLPKLYKAIDKAAKVGILRPNKAARMKSSLSKKLEK